MRDYSRNSANQNNIHTCSILTKCIHNWSNERREEGRIFITIMFMLNASTSDRLLLEYTHIKMQRIKCRIISKHYSLYVVDTHAPTSQKSHKNRSPQDANDCLMIVIWKIARALSLSENIYGQHSSMHRIINNINIIIIILSIVLSYILHHGWHTRKYACLVSCR